MRITVIGTGYVGLVSGTCLADVGHEVVCHDLEVAKIERLRRGEVPIYEPGLAELVHRNQRDGRLSFATELGPALHDRDACFICVGTPAGADGAADRHDVLEAA